MKTFLAKIAELGSIIHVTLISQRGELLYAYRENTRPQETKSQGANWYEIIVNLGNPMTADFVFAKGRYFLQKTSIGYLIVGMQNDSNLNKVRIACTTVSKKLNDHAIRRQTLLRLLTDAEDELKPHVIKELMPLADRSMAWSLLGLLKLHDRFKPDVRERLLLVISQALGYCGAPEAIDPLKELLEGTPAIGKNVANAARLAIQQLEQVSSTSQAIQATLPFSQPHSAPNPRQGNIRRRQEKQRGNA